MDNDELADLFARYVAALNARLTDEMSTLVAEEVEHNGDRMTRQAWWEQRVNANVLAVPDLQWRIDDLVVTGDRIMVRYTDSGTPTAPFAGREPNGHRLQFSEYAFYRVVDGRIAETWSLVDEAAIRDQLDA